MNTTKAATLKYALSSYKKMELVAKLIRWKTYYDANRLLKFTNKKSAKILLKLLNSAYSNCKNDTSIDLSKLYVSNVLIWRWPKIKRTRFGARSRVSSYLKYRSFVKIILDIK